MKLLYFDLETTGIDPSLNGIHQLSGCIEVDGMVHEHFDFNVAPNPGCDISDEALRVSGKTREEVMAYPPMRTVYTAFIHILSKYVDRYDKQDKFFLVGYNCAAFDIPFLRNWFVQNDDRYFGSWFWANSLDVFVLATQRLLDERSGMVDFKLHTVCRQLGIAVDESRLHDATYDIALTRALYQACTNKQ